MLGIPLLYNKEVCLQVAGLVCYLLVKVEDCPLAPQYIVFLLLILVDSNHVEHVLDIHVQDVTCFDVPRHIEVHCLICVVPINI
jgi:hypothetical protein